MRLVDPRHQLHSHTLSLSRSLSVRRRTTVENWLCAYSVLLCCIYEPAEPSCLLTQPLRCHLQNLIVESLRSIAEIVIWGDQVRSQPVPHAVHSLIRTVS